MTDDTLKVIIAGNTAVGKTTLIKAYLKDIGQNVPNDAPSGITIYTKPIKLPNGTEISAQFWDLSGQPAFTTVTPVCFKNTNVAILVYELTDVNSLKNLGEQWIKKIDDVNANKVAFGIIGNKGDLKDEKRVDNYITTGFIKKYEKMFKKTIHFAECSALHNENVKEAIEKILETAVAQSVKN